MGTERPRRAHLDSRGRFLAFHRSPRATATILFVAQDFGHAHPLRAELASLPHHLVVAEGLAEADSALRGSSAVDVVLLEGRLLAGDGASILAAARDLRPDATVVAFDEPDVIAREIASGSIGDEVITLELGSAGRIRRILAQALERTELLRERMLLRAAASTTWAMAAPIDGGELGDGGGHSPSIVTSRREAVLSPHARRGRSQVRLLDAAGAPAARAQPIRDGRIVGVAASPAAMTGEVLLREDERRLRGRLVAAASEWVHTFDSVDSPIAVVDAGGVLQRVNRAARDLIDEPYAQILGRPLSALPGEPWATALQLVAEGQPGSSPAFDARANRHWEVTLSVMASGGEVSDGGEPEAEPGRRWVMSAREVTRLIELQASLARARIMAAMGALVAEVAHETRNPLFALSATVDVFETRFGGEPDCARYASALRAQIDRLRRLMQDLLEYSKGVPVDRREPIRFEALVAEAVGAAQPGAQERAITIVQDDAPALPRVPANPARLVSAIHNLVQNAIQHSPAGSLVRVSTRLVERGVRLVECSVSDSGPGFRDEDLPRIFLPFFSRRIGGTGLGLTIVQHIVESHEGTIEARNIPEGGAMITFRLPVERPERGAP